MKYLGSVVGAALLTACAGAQTPEPQPQQPHGTVLFQSHGEAPEADADRKPLVAAVTAPDVADSVRAAVAITGYDLEAHLKPAAAEVKMHAVLTVRNDGAVPLTLLPLQVSSALHWESITIQRVPAVFGQHVLETDLDHTGRASEAVVTLPRPLAPGASVVVDAFYSGTLEASAERLTRIGATAQQGAAADWDSAGPAGVRLRGLGNVMWYPVAAVPAFLGEGAKVFQTLGRDKLANEAVLARLRLSVEYATEPPVTAFFCGRRERLVALSDNSAAPRADVGGIATAEFQQAAVGFRALDLFVLTDREQPEEDTAGGESSSSSPSSSLLAVSTADSKSVPRLLALSQEVSPLLEDWLGARPLTKLTVLNNAGQPFEDGPLLVAPIDALASSDAAPAMAHSLSHAWLATGQPWIDEGFAQFLALEWTERILGREAAVARLQELTSALPVGEPTLRNAEAVRNAPPGEPLIHTGNDVFYRRKAAAFWFLLRDVVGETALKAAISALAAEPVSHASPEEQALAFRKRLEEISHKDLAAFFDDWVLHDVGLPDLTVVDVTPRPLPAGKGHDSGWLVSITIRNEGAAVAEVPVVVRAGTFSTTRRMRIAGFATVTDRVLTEAQPTDIAVNDGGVVEARSSVHTRSLVLHEK